MCPEMLIMNWVFCGLLSNKVESIQQIPSSNESGIYKQILKAQKKLSKEVA
jgi:hypothetical protein